MLDRPRRPTSAAKVSPSATQEAAKELFEDGPDLPPSPGGAASGIIAVKASRALLDTISDGAVVLSDDGRVLGHNRTFAEMVGRPDAALTGEPFVSFFVNSDGAWIDAVLAATTDRISLEATVAAGKRVRITARRITWTPDSVICLTLADLGMTTAGFSAAQDSAFPAAMALPEPRFEAELDGRTARYEEHLDQRTHRPDATVRHDEARYRAAIETCAIGFCVLDNEGQVLEVNEALVRLLGFERNDLLKMRIAELQASAQPENFIARMATLSPPDDTRFETRLRCRDGRTVPVEISGAYTPTDGGRAFAFVADISARKEASRALRLSEQVLLAIIDNAESVIWVKDLQGQYLIINRYGEKVLGRSRHELLGRTVFDVFPQDMAQQCSDNDRRVIASGQALTVEEQVRVVDGERTFLAVKFPLRDANGRIYAVGAICTDISQRKAAEVALHEHQAILQSFYDSSPFMMTVSELDGDTITIISANDAMARSHGIEAATMVGKSLSAIGVPPEVTRPWLQQFRISREQHRPVRLDYEHPKPSGSRWLAGTAAYLGDSASGRPRFSFVAEDITERKNSEIELMRLGQIFDHLGTPVVFIDRDYRYRTVNPTYAAMFNLTPDDIIGQRAVDILGAESFAVVQPHLEAALAGQHQYFDLTRQFPDGKRRIVNLVYRPFVVAGEIQGVVVSMHDVTELRTTQQALEAHQERLEELVAERSAELREQARYLRALIDNFPFPVWLKDTESHYLAANRASAATSGLSVEELVGKTDADLCPGKMAERHRDDDQAVMASGEQKMIEEVVADDSGVRWIETWKAPVVSDDGAMLGTVGFTRDITERKSNEAAREAALAEAERLARARRHFLANMSHEIRTPLNAVLAMAQLGSRESYGRAAKERFVHIHEAGQFLLSIVDDILDVAKIEAGKLKLEQVPFALGEAIDRAVGLVAQRAYAKPVDFQVEEAPDLPAYCLGDSLRLSGILVNLLSNAVKFTPEGGRVTLSIGRDVAGLWFRIEDTGIGMAPDHLNRLFKPFEQADGSTTRKFGGTGLGLSICKHVVDLMGGDIRVETELGKGSTFEVRVPLREARAIPSPASFSGAICVTGLAAPETDAIVAGLRARGATVAVDADITHCTALVLGIGALAETATRKTVDAILARTGRVAAVVTPGQREIPEELRDCISLVERPVRARQLLAALATPCSAVNSTVHTAQNGSRHATLPRLKGYVILAIEDNEVNRLVIEEVLAAEGAQVRCLAGGRIALARLRVEGTDAYDIVLTDIQMPEMDGYETARRIAAIDRTLPVVGLTAHAMVEERARCLAAGMVEHVAKPINVDELVAVIQRYARPRIVSMDDEEDGVGDTNVAAPVTQSPPAGDATTPHPAAARAFTPLVDWERLAARFEGRTGFIDKLAATVRQAHAETADNLRVAARAGDMTTITYLAHSLNGMAGNLMAAPLAELAERTEHTARAGQVDAAQLCLQLADAVDAVLSVLAKRLGG